MAQAGRREIFTAPLMNWLDIALRILVATGAGMVIGLERELHHKVAGFRTHALVALRSALTPVIAGTSQRYTEYPSSLGIQLNASEIGDALVLWNDANIHSTEAAMLRSAMMAGVLALACAALPTEAHSHGMMGSGMHASHGFSGGKMAFGRHEESFGHRRFFDRHAHAHAFFRHRFDDFHNRFDNFDNSGLFDFPYGFPYDANYGAYAPPFAFDPEAAYPNLPPPPPQVAELPPCRETGAGGVVVLRGMSCSRNKP